MWQLAAGTQVVETVFDWEAWTQGGRKGPPKELDEPHYFLVRRIHWTSVAQPISLFGAWVLDGLQPACTFVHLVEKLCARSELPNTQQFQTAVYRQLVLAARAGTITESVPNKRN